MAAHVVDVAEHLLGRLGPMTAAKLQKLVYYCQAWHVAWCGVPLFDEPVEAWASGPVVPALFELHKGVYRLYPGMLYLADQARTSRVTVRHAAGRWVWAVVCPAWGGEVSGSAGSAAAAGDAGREELARRFGAARAFLALQTGPLPDAAQDE